MATRSASEAVKNAAGFDFLAASSPARTILLRSAGGASAAKFGGTISSKMHGKPALAKCAAMREPIVPAPSTTAFSMRRFMEAFQKIHRQDRLQNRHPVVKPDAPRAN